MINAGRTRRAERQGKEKAARTALNFESMRRNFGRKILIC